MFSFTIYGFIVGISLYISYYIIEIKAKKDGYQSQLDALSLPVLVCGILGARAWHVFTDFQLYQQHSIEMFYIWQGGISIIGGFIGAIIGTVIFSKRVGVPFLYMLDLFVFGVPFGQAIGRFGNYVNQELYGLPTTLPWKIFIDAENRVSNYSEFAYFHPLFFYEGICALLFGIWIWWVDKDVKLRGSGWYSMLYIAYYSTTRFLLEFLRLDKTMVLGNYLGLNQLILGVIAVYSVSRLIPMYGKKKYI